MDINNRFWITYGSAILGLAGGLIPGNGVRWYPAPQSYQVIPSGLQISQPYQNYHLHELGDIVPSADQPLLGPSANQFSEAYKVYLDNVDAFDSTIDPIEIKKQLEEAQVYAASRASVFMAARKEALNNWKIDCPNQIDPFTGEVMPFDSYAEMYYPSLDGLQLASNEAAARVTVLASQLTGPIGDQMARSLDGVSLAMQMKTSNPGYNFPCYQVEPKLTTDVINGVSPPLTAPPVYLPQYVISGTFNADAKRWVDSFPLNYTTDPAYYRARAKTHLRLSLSDSTSSTWSSFGFSQTVKVSGSRGWFLWRYRDTVTQQEITRTLNIQESDLAAELEIYIWDHNTYSLNPGVWWRGGLNTLPLKTNALPAVKSNVEWRLNQLLVGYGVEITFKFTGSAYSRVTTEINEMKTRNGQLSLFGSLFGRLATDYEQNTHSYTNIKYNSANSAITFAASPNGLPVVLAAGAVRNF